MSELTLEALGYTVDEARVARRAYDLTTPPEQRASNARAVLARSGASVSEQLPETTPTVSRSIFTEKAA